MSSSSSSSSSLAPPFFFLRLRFFFLLVLLAAPFSLSSFGGGLFNALATSLACVVEWSSGTIKGWGWPVLYMTPSSTW